MNRKQAENLKTGERLKFVAGGTNKWGLIPPIVMKDGDRTQVVGYFEREEPVQNPLMVGTSGRPAVVLQNVKRFILAFESMGGLRLAFTPEQIEHSFSFITEEDRKHGNNI